MKGIRVVSAAFLLLILGAGGALGASSQEIVSLGLTGVVDPFEASYISNSIEDAEADGASAVLITIDTPGGLDSSMREIIKSILNSDLPVLCYVSPSGARAASAGAFILLSCDVAAMAPGTNVGAASPVGVTGAIEQEKAFNDAAAFIRSIAEEKGRNPDWAESAVRDAVSATAEEALELGVIDSVQTSTATLLSEVDGQSLEKNGQTLVIETAGSQLVERDMGFGYQLLHGLLSPDLAFLFFYLGIALIIVEILHPGLSVPGVLGALSLVAAFIGFGMLPVEITGIVLLLASAGLFVLELKHPGVSVPGIAAVVTLIAGGLLLFDRSVPGSGVSLFLILPVAALMTGFFLVVVPVALRARRLPVVSGVDRVLGRKGIVVTDLNPEGAVHVGGELWTAKSTSGPILEGERIRVVEVDGLRLKVEPIGADKVGEAKDRVGGRA
jgi:membrane-bound serine protease (ClpP class)